MNIFQNKQINKFHISIYPLLSSSGEVLLDGILQLIIKTIEKKESTSSKNKFIGGEPKEIIKYLSDRNIFIQIYDRRYNEVSQLKFLESCINDDVVIFDATREGVNNEINNFDIANEHPKSLEHIWVVSRNYLPINFYGVDSGGYPDYKTSIKSNEEILEWIENKLSKIDFSRPRDNDEKGMKGWYKASDRTRGQDYREKNEQTNVFISFRTQYEFKNTIALRKKSYEKLSQILPLDTYNKIIGLSNKSFNANTNAFKETLSSLLAAEESIYIQVIYENAFKVTLNDINPQYYYSVDEVADRIEKGIYHSGISKSVKYLEDGNLVYSTELNTKQRIWQLLSIIDREYIMHCDELWVYGSDDYLDSWWTIGELIIFSFLLHQKIDKRENKQPRKLVLYNPKDDSIKEIEPPKINEQIAQRITRIQSNCAPSVMGFESVKSLRMMRNILYGNEEQHNKSLNEYIDILMKSILPMSLKEQGLTDDVIEQILNDEDSKGEIKNMLIPQLESMKEQVQSGNLSNELRAYYKQMLDIQNQQLPENLQNVVTEDDLIKTGLSEEYLNDPVFSEDFWETVVSPKYTEKKIDEARLEEAIKTFDSTLIEKHLELRYPGNQIVGNIDDLEKENISNIEGKRLIRKPSRFIFMPTRAGSIELSPTHNNLLEMPIFIVEK